MICVFQHVLEARCDATHSQCPCVKRRIESAVEPDSGRLRGSFMGAFAPKGRSPGGPVETLGRRTQIEIMTIPGLDKRFPRSAGNLLTRR